MKKLIASTAVAASLIGAGTALTLAPTGVGAQDDPAEAETETNASERRSTVAQVLDGLVEDGTLTLEQRDAVEEALRDARPHLGQDHGFGHHRRGPGFGGLPGGEVLEELGLDRETVRDGLADGLSLGEIADANGSSADALVEALTAHLDERLDDAVAAGRVDDATADDKRAEIADRIEDLVAGELDFGPRFGRR